MRCAIAVVCFSLVAPAIAQAENLSGVWTLRNHNKLSIKQAADGKVKVATKLVVNKRLKVRLVFKGSVSNVRVGTVGGLGVSAQARSFTIWRQGKRCMVKTPKLSLIGDYKQNDKNKRYSANGYVSGYIYCGGQNTWVRWAANLGGTWSTAR